MGSERQWLRPIMMAIVSGKLDENAAARWLDGCNNDRERADLDAIIAAVDAQHPPPALPRDVAMRVAEDAIRTAQLHPLHTFSDAERALIVDRHVPTDEEREAEREVVEAAVAYVRTVDSKGEWWLRTRDAADRLIAIRAKRGAR